MRADNSLIVQLFQALRKWPGLEERLFNPPASEESIQIFKKTVQKWGLPELPEIFYDFYRWHDGTRFDEYVHMGFDWGEAIYSLDDIVDNKETWDDLEAADTFCEWEHGVWWNTAWIPFLQRQGWWVGAIDTAGCFGGVPGQIIGFDYKSASGKGLEAGSFEEWVRLKLAYAEAGVLLPDKSEPDDDLNYVGEIVSRERERIFNEICSPYTPLIELWRYRRKTLPQNLHWDELDAAIASDDAEAVAALLDDGKVGIDEQNLYLQEMPTPLLTAIRQDAYAVALWLIRRGADPFIKDCYGLDALNWLERNYLYLCAVDERNTAMAQILSHLFSLHELKQRSRDAGVQLAAMLSHAIELGDEAMVDVCS